MVRSKYLYKNRVIFFSGQYLINILFNNCDVFFSSYFVCVIINETHLCSVF